jgi:hypothetical protein
MFALTIGAERSFATGDCMDHFATARRVSSHAAMSAKRGAWRLNR